MAMKKKTVKPGDSKKKSVLETGMLSFARSVQPSEGLFWGTRSANTGHRQPIEVVEKGVRGQSSEAKTDNPGKSNPQVVEAAAVPLGCDGIELGFSLTVFPNSREPWACGDPAVTEAYKALVKAYAERGGFGRLALLYCWNIANARFAWRNRYQSDVMRVIVEFDGGGIAFDPAALTLERPPSSTQDLETAVQNDALQEECSKKNINELVDWVRSGLEDERRILRVTWRAAMNEAEEIFPSQEYLRDEIKNNKNTPSRVYAKLPRSQQGRIVNQATMHSQKIGAALRHIDIWHEDTTRSVIAVNPYGGVQETGAVLRTKDGGKSFYALRTNANRLMQDLQKATVQDDIPPDAHFVIANLVRGGVFGE